VCVCVCVCVCAGFELASRLSIFRLGFYFFTPQLSLLWDNSLMLSVLQLKRRRFTSLQLSIIHGLCEYLHVKYRPPEETGMFIMLNT